MTVVPGNYDTKHVLLLFPPLALCSTAMQLIFYYYYYTKRCIVLPGNTSIFDAEDNFIRFWKTTEECKIVTNGSTSIT